MLYGSAIPQNLTCASHHATPDESDKDEEHEIVPIEQAEKA